ncbi:MAG: conjugal transfer pilus assembly protein TraW [Rickettsiaceae bacterium]|jgi:conjugal transfer pilus assembly protein TraW|nr:conjugal transfer pilus assembly protein TraW [Rickettsiaceae bacterium]
MIRIFSVIVVFIISSPVFAKDFGKSGQSFEIKEEGFEKMILRRLSERNIEEEQKKVEEKVKNKIQNPARVTGIIETVRANSYLYDPTYIVEEDIVDEKGVIIFPSGTRINALEQEQLDKQLFFLDGESKKQLSWLSQMLEQGKLKEEDTIILVGGSPITLEERFKRIFYFDQFGELTTKLGIKQAPAIVYQEGRALRVQEVLANEG